MNISNSKRALSLIPAGYLLVTRVSSRRDLFFLVGTSWFPAWWLLLRLGDLEPLSAAGTFLVGYLALLSAYEMGYLVNDTWDVRKSSDSRQRLPFTATPLYIFLFVFIRVGIWAIVAFSTGWIDQIVWLAGFAWLAVAFAEHNLLASRALRVASFVQLATLRFLLPVVAAIPTDRLFLAVSATILFYTYLRTLSYMDSKGLLDMAERKGPDFALKQMLVLAPAAIAPSIMFGETVLVELLAYFLAIYFAWAVTERTQSRMAQSAPPTP